MSLGKNIETRRECQDKFDRLEEVIALIQLEKAAVAATVRRVCPNKEPLADFPTFYQSDTYLDQNSSDSDTFLSSGKICHRSKILRHLFNESYPRK